MHQHFQRCQGLGITGVSLHCYRHSWAERASTCGYPMRFAQESLGHNSKAVHHAYAKNAEVIVPSLADWESHWQKSQPLAVLPNPTFPLPAVTPLEDSFGEESQPSASAA